MNSVIENHAKAKLRNALEALRNGREWTNWHWVIVVVPCALIGLNSFFSTSILASQEGFRFATGPEFFLRVIGYCSWALVFRGAWAIENVFRNKDDHRQHHRWLAHGGFAFVASILFIGVFSPLFFASQYPETWRADAFARVFQVWLEHTGLLFFTYAAGAALLANLRKPAATHTPPPLNHRLEVNADGARKIIAIETISWIEAMGNYVTLHLDDGSLMVRSSLNDIESQLENMHADAFFRVHRGALVNIAKVASHRRRHDGVYEIQMAGGETAPLSRQKLSAFRARLRAH